VLARNPTLAEMEAAVRAARARAEQSTALEDPMASATVAPLSLGGGAPFGYEVRASQRIPYPGKLRLRGEAARQEADAAAAELEATRLELAIEAVERFADYYLNAREL
jgi:outer membrane protein TolC